eukprot:4932326-Amphidinium_carterae.1
MVLVKLCIALLGRGLHNHKARNGSVIQAELLKKLNDEIFPPSWREGDSPSMIFVLAPAADHCNGC